MRRILTFVILPILILALAVPSVAESGGIAAVTAAETITAGDTLTVTVSISEADLILAAMVEPIYDSAVFELVEGSFLQSGALSDFNDQDGVIAWDTPQSPNGELAVFTLRAKQDAPLGEYTVGCRYSVRDSSDNLVTCNSPSVQVTIGENTTIPGDLNQDGEVNNLDVQYLLWYTLFPEDYPVIQNVDYDHNGEVNNKDVQYLLWYTLFPEDYPI